MAKKNQQLVLAIFDSEADAQAAAEALKKWDKANDDVKAGAVGVIAKDSKGKLKEDLLGARAGRKGAKIGTILGIAAAIPTGGLSLLGGVAGGALGGGVVGSLFHKQLGLSDEDKVRLDQAIDGGKAAVGVLVASEEATAFVAKLAELGGASETHEVSEEAEEAIDAAVAAEATSAATDGTSASEAATVPLAAANEEVVSASGAEVIVAASADEDVLGTDAAAVAAADTDVPKRAGADFSPTTLPGDSATSEVM